MRYVKLCIAAFILFSANPVYAEDEHLGLTEFEVACMPCHGLDGKGNGPHAKKLKVAPPDLTQILKKNDGTFPFYEILEIIDGREKNGAHVKREMPIWGARYRMTIDSDESKEEAESRARKRINALVEYLRTIQEP